MAKLFYLLTPARLDAIRSALTTAGLSVTIVAGTQPRLPAKEGESIHQASCGMLLRLTWSSPPTEGQIAAASAVVTAYVWE